MVGFPLKLILSWIFDITSSGVRRTESAGVASRRTSVVFEVGGLTASVALAALVGWFLMR